MIKPKRHNLFITSLQRNGAKAYNTTNETGSFSVNLAAQINSKKVKDIRLISAQIPVSNYNVTSSNNIVPINDGSNKTVTITPGSYTAIQLALAIQTALNSSSSGWTCTYNANTYKITISGTATFVLRFGTVTTNSIARTIGFSNTDITFGSAATGESAVKLNFSNYFIVCPELGFTTELVASNSSLAVAFVIPIDKNTGDILNYMPDEQQQINGSKLIPNELNISLFSDNFTLVDLNNADWSFVISFEEI